MIPAERFYRQSILAETLERAAIDVALLSPGLPETSVEYRSLDRVRNHLHLAVLALQIAQHQSRTEYAPELLAEQLRASIELLHASPERMRAEENGELA